MIVICRQGEGRILHRENVVRCILVVQLAPLLTHRRLLLWLVHKFGPLDQLDGRCPIG